jgi:hypothetical protein
VPVIRASVPRFAVATLAAIVLVAGTAYWQTSAVTADTGIQDPGCAPYTICLRHQGPPGAPVVALTGDSIARSLDPAFVLLAQEHGWTYVLSATGSCRVAHLMTAVNGGAPALATLYQQCYDKTPGVQQELLAKWHPKMIVDIDYTDQRDIELPDGSTLYWGKPDNLAAIETSMVAVTRQFTGAGARVALLEMMTPLGVDCAKPQQFSSSECRVPATRPWIDWYNAVLEKVAANVPGVSTISITDTMCPGRLCVAELNGIVIRYDGYHFTVPAARWLAPFIYAQLVRSGAVPASG